MRAVALWVHSKSDMQTHPRVLLQTRQCSQILVALHGSGSTRRLRLRPASITMGRVGQGSTPMPVAPMLPMKLILMAGPWIVLSSCTAQGNWYTHAPSDREHLHPRRLLGSASAHPGQPRLEHTIERKEHLCISNKLLDYSSLVC